MAAWHRAERGETFRERVLAFENWDTLTRVLTGRRMERLHDVRRHRVPSVRTLAKGLGRNDSNVHADVRALTAAGLLDATDGMVRAGYNTIRTRIAIDGPRGVPMPRSVFPHLAAAAAGSGEQHRPGAEQRGGTWFRRRTGGEGTDGNVAVAGLIAGDQGDRGDAGSEEGAAAAAAAGGATCHSITIRAAAASAAIAAASAAAFTGAAAPATDASGSGVI